MRNADKNGHTAMGKEGISTTSVELIHEGEDVASGLIGYTGFVGRSLRAQYEFESIYRKSTIENIRSREFDILVCAGAPGMKWLANAEPKDDWESISRLTDSLKSAKCRTFVLISTVDVFRLPVDVDEDTTVSESELHPYGLHRYRLEKFVASTFPNHLIVRLPGLVGSLLKKNVLFDFRHNNDVSKIDSRGIFQFYPIEYLWRDIQIALENKLKLVHLVSEPINVAEIAEKAFDRTFVQEIDAVPAHYDVQTVFASRFGAIGSYQYTGSESLVEIVKYARHSDVSLTDTKGD